MFPITPCFLLLSKKYFSCIFFKNFKPIAAFSVAFLASFTTFWLSISACFAAFGIAPVWFLARLRVLVLLVYFLIIAFKGVLRKFEAPFTILRT